MINDMTPQGYPLEAIAVNAPGARWLVIGWTSEGRPVGVYLSPDDEAVPVIVDLPVRYALPAAGEPTKVRGARPPQLSGPANSQQA